MSANKARGTKFESATRDYLNGANGYSRPADWKLIKRAAQTGRLDVGDLHAWPFVIQNKDVKSPSVPSWLRAAEKQAENAGFPYGVVVHKVRGKGPALARVHISETTWDRILTAFPDVLSGALDLTHNARGAYWTLTLAEFAQVLRIVRERSSPDLA